MAGRPPRSPNAQQLLDAYEYGKTGAHELDIVRALKIPISTYNKNKHLARWKEFRAEIERGRGTGNVLVLGQNYKAATSTTDPTRAAARALHLKHSGSLRERVEVTGEGGKPIKTQDTGPRGPAMTATQAKAILAEISRDRTKD